MLDNINLPTIAILAGGYGTRLYPKTKKIPKAFIKLNSKPFLFHQLKLLEKNKFKKVVICVGYKSELIKNYLNKSNLDFNLKIIVSDDGNKKLGTGGAVKKALNNLGKNFFVIFGDSFLDVNYKDIYKKFIKFLEKLPKNQLKQLAGANIKFVSMLAKNRLRGESVKERSSYDSDNEIQSQLDGYILQLKKRLKDV